MPYGCSSASLTCAVCRCSQVQRQTLAEYRGAVEELRQDPARGFQRLEEMGAVREVEWSLRPQEVSQAYRAALATDQCPGTDVSGAGGRAHP